MASKRRPLRREPALLVERLAPTLDRLVVVASFRSPEYKPGIIDRLLVLAHHAGVAPLIVLNKVDLADDPADVAAAAKEHTELGYDVLCTSVVDGTGIAELADAIREGRSALSGHSGVGKSSLLKAVDPDVTSEVRTGEVSEVTGKGRHTTTRVRVWRLTSGAEVIDLPGVRLLDLAYLEPEDVYAAFPETNAALGRCRFGDCSHGPEPGCAVKEALASEISDRRRESLDRILESVTWGNP